MIVIPWDDLPAVCRKGDQIKWIDLQNGAHRQSKAHVDAAHGPFTVFDPLILPDVHPGEGGHLLLGEAFPQPGLSEHLRLRCYFTVHFCRLLTQGQCGTTP